jgi:hypothetical protein
MPREGGASSTRRPIDSITHVSGIPDRPVPATTRLPAPRLPAPRLPAPRLPAPRLPRGFRSLARRSLGGGGKPGDDTVMPGHHRLICRTGKSLHLGPPHPEKIFRFPCRANQLYPLAPSRPIKRGVGHRHERGAGCGGRGSVGRSGVIAGRVSRERSLAAQTNGANARRSLWAKTGGCVR